MPLDFDLDRELEGRGGVRGGQGDFKWADVVTDQHRENYKNRGAHALLGIQSDRVDVTWYNKDKAGAEDERRKEIKRIKRAEEDALSIALGFAPTARPVGDSDSETEALKPGEDGQESKESKEARRAERKARKEERRLAREARDERRRERHRADDRDRDRDRDAPRRRDYDDRDRARTRSRSPPPRRRSRSPDRRPRSPEPRHHDRR